MKRDILNLLIRSFDGDLTREERDTLEAALAASEEVREERARLVRLRQAVSSARADFFNPFFAERLMQRIRHERMAGAGTEALFGALAGVFRPVAVAGMVLAIGLIIYNLATTNDISLTGAVGVSGATYEEVMEPPVEAVLEVLS